MVFWQLECVKTSVRVRAGDDKMQEITSATTNTARMLKLLIVPLEICHFRYLLILLLEYY